MPRPTPATLLRQLNEVVKRMEAVEKTLKTLEADVDILQAWHHDTELAKKLYEDWKEQHKPVEITNNDKTSAKTIAILGAAVAALTAVVVALA